MKKMKVIRINPNTLKVRDLLIVKLICGSTKSGVATDRKKKANKLHARKRVKQGED